MRAGQTLERHARLGHLDPAMQAGVVGEQLEDRAVRAEDVGGVARERRPPERPAALAELWPDERGHEPGVRERVLDARLLREGAKVVAVVEDHGAGGLEGQHRADVGRHRAARPALVLLGKAGPELDGIGQRDLRGDVAAERVVGRRLVGHEVEAFAGGGPGRLDLRGVADERDAHGLPAGGRLARPGEGLGGVMGQAVDVARSRAGDGPAPRRPRWRCRPRRSS